jgi:hypothetical protein
MFAMCVDNCFWISSSPEYPQYQKYSFKEKLNYIFNFRIKSVLTDWRDICPALITSIIMCIVEVYYG